MCPKGSQITKDIFVLCRNKNWQESNLRMSIYFEHEHVETISWAQQIEGNMYELKPAILSHTNQSTKISPFGKQHSLCFGNRPEIFPGRDIYTVFHQFILILIDPSLWYYIWQTPFIRLRLHGKVVNWYHVEFKA